MTDPPGLRVCDGAGASGIGMKPGGTAGNCTRCRRIHLCTGLALSPWLRATPATEAPGWTHSSTTWVLKDLE